MTGEPADDIIEKRVRSRCKGEIIDYILRCRDILDKCTAIISSPFCEDWKRKYYTSRFKKVLNRCQIAGNILIQKIGENPYPRTVIYIATRHPDVFEGFIKERYFKPAWDPVIRSMIDKGYLSKEDLYIIKVLGMMKRFVLYISLGDLK